MSLTAIILTPAAPALACLLVRSRRAMETAPISLLPRSRSFSVWRLLGAVLAQRQITEWDQFLYADALSAWMVLLIAAVSLGTSLYAGRYFQRDLDAGALSPGRVREFFVLSASLCERDVPGGSWPIAWRDVVSRLKRLLYLPCCWSRS